MCRLLPQPRAVKSHKQSFQLLVGSVGDHRRQRRARNGENEPGTRASSLAALLLLAALAVLTTQGCGGGASDSAGGSGGGGGEGGSGASRSEASASDPADGQTTMSDVRLPPWLTYCDVEPCVSSQPLIVNVCPGSDARCTPARATSVVPQVDGRPISGVFFPLFAPAGDVMRIVSGNGQASSSLLWAYQASKVIVGFGADVRISYYDLTPGADGMTVLNFASTRLTSALLDSIFYRYPAYDVGTAAADLHERGQAIIALQQSISGLTPERVTAFFMPTELAAVQGEGNFSYGNGTVTINYGNPPYIAAVGGILNAALPRFAHEHSHELFDEIRTAFPGNATCLNEGIADALPYVAGFLPEEDFGPIGLRGSDFDAGCTALQEAHDVGNCYFWHVKKAGMLTSSFLYGVFHPQHLFHFDSCTQNALHTGNSILVYFTEAAGGADMVPALDSMKIPHSGSYAAAKQALGF